MRIDYLFTNQNNELSTYFEDQIDYLKQKGNAKRYVRINMIIEDCKNYSELAKRLEIKNLDSKTGLKEIKLDKIRALHFLYLDNTIVLLGTFIKKTKKCPKEIIEKNNNRIKLYREQKNGQL